VRSEHLDVVPEGQGIWQGRVVHSEDLGSDNYLFVEIGAKEPVIVRQAGKLSVPLGATVALMPRAGMLHRFDESGRPVQAAMAAE
jgi:multiple sugar transport system ATP-binding protein